MLLVDKGSNLSRIPEGSTTSTMIVDLARQLTE
jgi:hypothetical protein